MLTTLTVNITLKVTIATLRIVIVLTVIMMRILLTIICCYCYNFVSNTIVTARAVTRIVFKILKLLINGVIDESLN